MEKFRELGLNEDILTAIEKKGYKEPSPVQAEVIPFLLSTEQDILAMAQTGTGKTAAFGLPICQNLKADGIVKALIICPTRELAVQVCNEMKSFVSNPNFKLLPVYGGQPFRDQKRALSKGVDVVVGTPGRLIEAIQKEKLIMDDLQYVVLDEVDEMMNMGFIEDIEFILQQAPKECRRMMFSATLPSRIEKIAKKYLTNSKTFKVDKSEETKNLIQHICYKTDRKHRFEALTRVLAMEEGFYGIIFCQTKAETEVVASELNNKGISAEYLHGDIQQNSRETILNRFKSKKCSVLVATDVAARGIDVDNLTHVVHYSVPESAEAYTHRCGRTGRKGNTGKAITIAVPEGLGRLDRIAKRAGFDIKKQEVPDGGKIATLLLKQFHDKIIATEATDLNREIAADLLEDASPADLLAKILEHFAGDTFNPQAYKTLPKPRDTHGGSPKSEMRIRFNKGLNDDFTGRTLITFIERKSGLPGRNINNLHLKRNFCTFTVPARDASSVIDKLNRRCGSADQPIARIDSGPPTKSKAGFRRKRSRRN